MKNRINSDDELFLRNGFCGMANRRKANTSQYHCQRFSPSQTFLFDFFWPFSHTIFNFKFTFCGGLHVAIALKLLKSGLFLTIPHACLVSIKYAQANLQQTQSRIWTCPDSEFRLCQMWLSSCVNHYTMVPHINSISWKRNCYIKNLVRKG